MQELYQHPRNNIDLYGYLVDNYSLDLYHKHRDNIRTWLTWKPEIESSFRAVTQGISWVGLHVRRGDYVKPGRIIPLQTYMETLTRVRKNLPVYLASDDPAARNELDSNILLNIKNPLPDLYAYTPNDIFDFWMLQHAAIVIGGGSTFSWWASFLNPNSEYYAPPLTHLWGKSHIAPPPIVRQWI
jgi:hypothetical protein